MKAQYAEITVYYTSLAKGLEQGRPNLNPMSAKLHRFDTKIGVQDLFALGLEQFESKKTGQGQNNISKRKIF